MTLFLLYFLEFISIVVVCAILFLILTWVFDSRFDHENLQRIKELEDKYR